MTRIRTRQRPTV